MPLLATLLSAAATLRGSLAGPEATDVYATTALPIPLQQRGQPARLLPAGAPIAYVTYISIINTLLRFEVRSPVYPTTANV